MPFIHSVMSSSVKSEPSAGSAFTISGVMRSITSSTGSAKTK